MGAIDLVGTLMAMQNGEGWTDARMARELGVSPAMWCMVKAGERRPGTKLLGGVERRFPNLRPLVSLFLRGELPRVSAA